jgi:DNA-binding NtrC family response regulator
MNPFPHDLSYCPSNQQQSALLPQVSSCEIAESKTVLVVDDDSDFRQLEVRALCQKGYNVVEADCAAEALRVAGKTANLHLLLTDFNMPGADGVELTRQIRNLHPTTPVLMVSGSLPLIPHEAMELERFAILEKSLSFENLLEKVRTLLAK